MSISAQFPALLAHPAAFCTTTAFEIAEAESPTPELRKRGPIGPLLVLFKFGSDRDSRRLRPSGSGALAGQHRVKGIATTFVLIDSERPSRILGYYSLSAASLAFERLTEADRKGLPAYPVPAVRIGRLATSVSVRGQGLGELLLQNAIKRILQARNTLGVHALGTTVSA
jgi:GNAT superfamily N-acetyltransferase